MALKSVHSHDAVAGAGQMLAFNITASRLELSSSEAINPVESSVSPPVLLCSGVRELNPFSTHIIIIRFPGWIRTRPGKGSSVTYLSQSIVI
jgi:hypothetical protein